MSAVAASSWIPTLSRGHFTGCPPMPQIAVPREVDQPSVGAGHLDHDTVSIETVVCVPEVGASQSGDGEKPGVGAQRGDPGRPVVEIIHPVAHVAPVDRRPPGFPVVGSRPTQGVTNVGLECFDLGRVEDRAEVHEADLVQESAGLCDWVLEGEALREVHIAPCFVLHAGWMVEIEEGLIAEGHTQWRLPARHLAEATPEDLQLIGVEERKTRLELPHEGTPCVVGELDDSLRGARAGPDGERLSFGHVGVGPTIG